MNIGHLILTIVVVLILAGLLRGLVGRGIHPAAAVAVTAVAALFIRGFVHAAVDMDVFHFWVNSWGLAFVLLVLVAAVAIVRAWGLGLALAMVAFLFAIGIGPNVPNARADGPTQEAPEVVDFGPQRDADDCVQQHNVVLDPNSGNRVDSDGVQDTNGDGVVSESETTEQTLALAAHDPRALFNATKALRLDGDAPVERPLDFVEQQDGRPSGCYNERARDLYQRVVGVFVRATAQNGEAPAEGTNTGAYPNGEAFAVTGPIEGNRAATEYTNPDGSKFWILHRCDNIVVTGPPPDIPTPTTTPTPTTVPPTTSSTVVSKCIDPATGRLRDGADLDGDGYCGSPRSGPEQQDEPSTAGPTPGYEENSAEDTVAQQPTNQDVTQTPQGTNSGSGSGAPGGTYTAPDGSTSSGTDSGTQTPQDTEGSGQTSSGDTGEPASFQTPVKGADPVLLLLGGLLMVSTLPGLLVRPRRYLYR